MFPNTSKTHHFTEPQKSGHHALNDRFDWTSLSGWIHLKHPYTADENVMSTQHAASTDHKRKCWSSVCNDVRPVKINNLFLICTDQKKRKCWCSVCSDVRPVTAFRTLTTLPIAKAELAWESQDTFYPKTLFHSNLPPDSQRYLRNKSLLESYLRLFTEDLGIFM